MKCYSIKIGDSQEFLCPHGEAVSTIEDELSNLRPGDALTVAAVEMSEEAYDKLQEFPG